MSSLVSKIVISSILCATSVVIYINLRKKKSKQNLNRPKHINEVKFTFVQTHGTLSTSLLERLLQSSIVSIDLEHSFKRSYNGELISRDSYCVHAFVDG